jgi:hypothetical protein
VRPAPARAQLGTGVDDGPRGPRHRAAIGAATPAGRPSGELEPTLAEVSERLRDIERRLSRIEAELGALR